jgi:hypothetical protein
MGIKKTKQRVWEEKIKEVETSICGNGRGGNLQVR